MNNKSIPMVSIHMIVYNQEHLIAESIESVINQSYKDWELIIGDDCSDDGTFEIALRYQKKYPNKIKLFKNENNLGITKNCNKVLSRCNGKYISFIAGDDLFLPDKIEKQLSLMENNQDCILSYHDIEVFDGETGELIRFWNHGVGSSKAIIGDSLNVAKALVTKGTSFMAALSVMVKRCLIPKSGYDCRIPVASDWAFWIDICANNKGHVLYLDNVLARYRKHSKGVTSKPIDHHLSDDYITLALTEYKYPCLNNEVRKARGRINYMQGVIKIENKNYVDGKRLLIGSAKYSIYSIKFIGWILYSYYKQFLNYFR